MSVVTAGTEKPERETPVLRDRKIPMFAGAAMATILSFKAAGRSSQSSGRTGMGCEIVLFPGVRYEYNLAPQEPAKPKRKSPRKRDKLVLQD